LERTNSPDLFRPRLFDGWALDVALALDQAHPGFLAQSFRGSILARQARFAAFAAIDLHHPGALVEALRKVAPSDFVSGTISPVAQIAAYLLSLRARCILNGLYGSCPDGVVGLFARLGDSPISPDPHVYRLAWSLFAEPQHRQRAKLLMQSEGTITAARIRVVSELDGILLRRSVLDRLATSSEVASFREAVRLIKSLVPEADETRLGQSLDALGPCNTNHRSRIQSLATWTLGWLEGMQTNPVEGPFPQDDADLRLLVGPALLDAGRRYRNCLPQHLGHVAVGRRLYYEWLQEPGAIIELNCLRNGQGQCYYSVGQIQGVRNAHLRPEVLNAIRARLIRGGVLFHGAAIGQQAPLYGLLNIFEDEDVGDTYVSFLDGLEETGDEQPIEVA
jgi:hypothetical protein